jgi:dsRNA-specific ribonuclease
VLAGVPRGRGEGRSKKHAEQGAAREAWHELNAMLLARNSSPAPGA